MSKVYIIIVNFNGWKDTVECLESLLKLNYLNYQIIIVDNSPDLISFNKIILWANQGVPIETKYPYLVTPYVEKPFLDFIAVEEQVFLEEVFTNKIILVKAIENRGFSAGNNIALRYIIKLSDCDFVWLLNNDTVAPSDALTCLIDHMALSDNSFVGILGSKVMEYEERDIIQSAGGGILITPFAYPLLLGAGKKDTKQFDSTNVRMNFVAGTSMFVRKAFLNEVGLLNEEYFLYFEEPDWAQRGNRSGWNIGYCHKSKIYHKGGSSTGGKGYSSGVRQSTAFSDFYFQRSKVLFTRRYYFYWLPVLYLSFVLVIFNRLRRGQFDRIRTLVFMLLRPSRKYPLK